MDEPLHSLLLGLKLAYVAGLAAAAFAFCTAAVWKLMAWAPVNITVNVCTHDKQ